jgi:hypothetical protein
MSAYAYHLEKVEWAVWGIATWDGTSKSGTSEASEQLRRADFFRIIGKTCTRLRLRHRHLAIYAKTEWGRGRRGHCHFLIAKHGTQSTTPAILAATIQELWSAEHGLAKVEPFDVTRQCDAVAYQCKQEFDAGGIPILHPEYVNGALQSLLRKNAECALSETVPSPDTGLQPF